MIKYKKLFDSRAKMKVLEGDVFTPQKFREIELFYDAHQWAVPLCFITYSDIMYREHKAVRISFLCLHLVISKYIW